MYKEQEDYLTQRINALNAKINSTNVTNQELKNLIEHLKRELEGEKDNNLDVKIHLKELRQQLSAYEKEMQQKDRVIDEFRVKVDALAQSEGSLQAEVKRVLKDNDLLKARNEKLRFLESLSLDRESIQPRLDFVKKQEEEMNRRQEYYEKLESNHQ